MNRDSQDNSSSVPDTLAPGRRRAIVLVLLFGTYLLVEAVAYVGLRVLDAKGYQGYAPTLTSSVSEMHQDILTRVITGEAKYIGYDSKLGWTTLPYGKNELYEANSQGVRGTREYAIDPPKDTLRLAAFGDSFVHGDDEINDHAWSIVMEQTDSQVEVMNFGVGGYGPDQGYLRYLHEGKGFAPDIVLIGFQSENINRVVNVFRPFYSPTTGNPLAKPYFKLRNGKTELQKNPIGQMAGYEKLLNDPGSMLPGMGEADFHYQFRYRQGIFDWSAALRLWKVLFFEYRSRFANPIYSDGVYDTSSEAYALTVAVIRDFYCDVLGNDSLPVVVLFPNRSDVNAYSNGDQLSYLPLKNWLAESDYLGIDLAEAFSDDLQTVGVRELIRGHYTPRGNELVAEFLLEEIARMNLNDSALRDRLIQNQLETQCSAQGKSDAA
jgi:hypothetical protein